MNILEKYGLSEKISFSLDLTKKQFVELFNQWIEPEKGFGLMLDEYYSKRRKYWGKIDTENFTIREKKKLFGFRIRTSNAQGFIKTQNDKTEIKIVLKSYNWMIALGAIGLLFVFIFGIISVTVNKAYFGIGIILTIALIWYSFIFLRLKYDLKIFKRELTEIIETLSKTAHYNNV